MAMSFHNTFDLSVTVVRPFNTYGPRQSARAVIPSIITQIAAGKEVKLGDMTPTRDFNYVTDTCRGFVLLAECEAAIGKTVNIGSGKEISVGDTLALIRRIMNSDAASVTDAERIRPPNSEVFRLCCDNTLIRKLTGFEPEYSLEAGLRRTVEWFRDPANLAKYKTDIYNV